MQTHDPLAPATAGPRSGARRLARGLGLLVALAAVAWIGWRFAQSGALSRLEQIPRAPSQLAATLAALAFAYAGALCVLAYAWWRLLAGLAPEPPPKLPTMTTWAVSQYARYLPGNVAHYALRHAWSRRYATSHAVLGLAALGEAALLLLAALLLTLSGGTSVRLLPGVDARLALASLSAAMLVGLALWRRLRRRGGIRGWTLPELPPAAPVVVFACDLAFFAATAGILCGIGHLLGTDAGWPMMLVAGAASWAAGFVVIGAPAGLGVRETVFVALTGGALGEENALLMMAMYRLVTFSGDTLLFAAGTLLMRRLSASTRPARPD